MYKKVHIILEHFSITGTIKVLDSIMNGSSWQKQQKNSSIKQQHHKTETATTEPLPYHIYYPNHFDIVSAQ